MAIPIHVYIGSRFCYILNTDSARGQVSNNQADKMRAEYCLRLQVHVSVGVTIVERVLLVFRRFKPILTSLTSHGFRSV